MADAKDTDAQQRAKAQRCLQRYVHEPIRPKQDVRWADWYAQHSANLVFVDSAGFWWMLDPTKAR